MIDNKITKKKPNKIKHPKIKVTKVFSTDSPYFKYYF